MVKIYQKKWQKQIIPSFLAYLRDIVITLLPVNRLPSGFVKKLYGVEPKFAFLVHPRNYDDIFVALPFLKPFKFLLRKQMASNFFSSFPPFVLNVVKTPYGVNGIVISQITVPEVMLKRRKKTVKSSLKALRLISKICTKKAVVGLGGWLPMITQRGVGLEKYAAALNLRLTNGHCGTLVSIYMTVEKIAEAINMPMQELNLAIIGVGKMGANVAKIFNPLVHRLVLIDINAHTLNKVQGMLRSIKPSADIRTHLFDTKKTYTLRSVLEDCHVGICATSTLRNLLRLKELPLGFIVIDDSRPEALPRDLLKNRIILEGGLLKIPGAQVDYDYGFGKGGNVFGCLGEAFLLALDTEHNLKPTLGDVDPDNFQRMLAFCKKVGVREGDLISCDMLVKVEDIQEAFSKR